MSTSDTATVSRDDEAILVDRARDGDQEAAGRLCERYRDSLVSFCFRYLNNDSDAEDAAQEVLAKVALANDWPTGSFRAWLYRLSRNRSLDYIRQRRDGRVGIGTLFCGSSLRSPRTGPRTGAVRRERDEQLRQHLTSLTTQHAEILTLRYFSDLGRQEIAEVLEVSESVVKARLSAARRELARRIEQAER